MYGTKYIYISRQSKVFKVPKPKGTKFKAISELAGQDVLRVTLCYETKDRKPNRLTFVEFERKSLDSEGAYELTDDERMKAWHNASHFMYASPEDLAKRDGPLVLPLAPSIPTSKEKTVLYEYLDKNFTILRKDTPRIVEQTIISLQDTHQKMINMIKTANKLRGS